MAGCERCASLIGKSILSLPIHSLIDFVCRHISEEEYLQWSVTYDAAASAVRDRDEAIDKANELIEHSLLILGATALEDKLQEGVPDAIEQLHRAGIKLWILTGDKLQTAIEIGYSCNLLKADMEVMIISATTADGARTQIEAGLNKIASVLGPPVVNQRFSIGHGKLPPGLFRPRLTIV
jgi:phospholipid-translocating ATPase